VSFADDCAEPPRLTSRLAERYRLHLLHLRTITRMCLDGAQERAMLEAIDDLADTLMAGGPSVVHVELPPAPVGVVLDQIETLLDDTAAVTDCDRDHRVAS
jgi:hypothetical protein